MNILYRLSSNFSPIINNKNINIAFLKGYQMFTITIKKLFMSCCFLCVWLSLSFSAFQLLFMAQ